MRKGPRPGKPDIDNRIIENQRDFERAMRALTISCPYMARATTLAGPLQMRRWSAGFDGLVRIVVGQQLSTASANAIMGRLEARVVPLDAAGISATSDADLLACGLSRSKLATLRALAVAVDDRVLDFVAMPAMSADDVRKGLVTVRGIGPWTADIYLLFCRGEADAFPSGDLALQVAAQHLFDLDARPGPAALEEIADRWRPWRGVAATTLWAYYAYIKAKPRKVASAEPVVILKRARATGVRKTGTTRKSGAKAPTRVRAT